MAVRFARRSLEPPVKLVAGAGDLTTDELAAAPLPWTIVEAVRRQVDGLEPGVRTVVSAASVLGRRVPFDRLAVVTHLDEDELIDHLRAAVDAGILAALAERLFISPRTAAVHVSNILGKLGMASRVEVAAWAVREGLTER